MFDMHHLGIADGMTELWYDEKYPETLVVLAWTTLVKRCAPLVLATLPVS